MNIFYNLLNKSARLAKNYFIFEKILNFDYLMLNSIRKTKKENYLKTIRKMKENSGSFDRKTKRKTKMVQIQTLSKPIENKANFSPPSSPSSPFRVKKT